MKDGNAVENAVFLTVFIPAPFRYRISLDFSSFDSTVTSPNQLTDFYFKNGDAENLIEAYQRCSDEAPTRHNDVALFMSYINNDIDKHECIATVATPPHLRTTRKSNARAYSHRSPLSHNIAMVIGYSGGVQSGRAQWTTHGNTIRVKCIIEFLL